MSQLLRQSTAVTLQVGPFIDDTDGKTAEIALDIDEGSILLSKNGGAFTLKSDTTHGVHDAAHNGWYTMPLNTTDTNTLGTLDLAVNFAGALPVWKSFMVIEEQVWDSICGADLLDVSVVQVAGTGQTAGDVTAKINTIDGIVDDILVDTGTTLDGAIAALPTDADVNAACDTAISDAALATATSVAALPTDADVNAACDTAISDAALATAAAVAALPTDADVNAACDTAISDAALATAAALATVEDFVDTEVASILAAVDTEVAALVAAVITNAAGADVAADIIAVKGVVDDVLLDTAVIGALGAGLTALATQTSVDDLPTSAELATALAGADDAVLAAVATVDGIVDDILVDTAVIGALGAGLTALATQTSVDDLPTSAELATALAGADDAVLAAVAALPTDEEIAAAVLSELPADYYDVAGSVGRVLYELRQRSAGKVVIDRDAATIKVYTEDGMNLIFTLTMGTVGDVDTLIREDPA